MENSWYTVEAIDPQTYAISEYGHWEQVHSYLFIGSEKAALIDTGTGIGNIREEVERLTKLPIIVVTTHCHWDHIGCHAQFDRIGIHEADQEWLENGIPIPFEMIKEGLMREPFTADPPPDFSADTYQLFTGKPDILFTDGAEIDLGERTLTVIHTPGHAPGHICLYERETGYLVTADILYEGTIYAHYPSTDPKALSQSVERLMQIPHVEKPLPGHNRLHIPVHYLEELHRLCKEVEAADQLRHGTGLHQGAGVSLLF